ncbi:MAG: glycosyltransferase family 4 protein [Planctomycetales bacterium]|nr:glycosyltransferase family 4 protein [Planctomycetales bacterium]
MRILTVLTYYRPHTSGLTIYAERLARALVFKGHEVTILTSQFAADQPRHSLEHGVRVVRVPVAFRLGKGVLMPRFPWTAFRLMDEHDIVHLHLPQLDGAAVALLARLKRKPVVSTYHCDLNLPAGLGNRMTGMVMRWANNTAGRCSHRVAAYTDDFAEHSPFLRRFRSKRRIILPPVELPTSPPATMAAVASANNPDNRRPVIGMATRFATEKGIEVLLAALPRVLKQFPQALVWFAGQHEGVWGEEKYRARLNKQIEKFQQAGAWKFLGTLPPEQLAAFYSCLDVLVVPSLNLTETFGLVQIEAMLHGTPVIASNLPGVRQPVQMSGMGMVIPIGDAESLANAIGEVCNQPKSNYSSHLDLAKEFSPQTNAERYIHIYRELTDKQPAVAAIQ